MEGESSSGGFKLHEQLELRESRDRFVIESKESPGDGFFIDRRDGSIELLADGEFPSFFLFFFFPPAGSSGAISVVFGTVDGC